jgi:hypothetical protein
MSYTLIVIEQVEIGLMAVVVQKLLSAITGKSQTIKGILGKYDKKL